MELQKIIGLALRHLVATSLFNSQRSIAYPGHFQPYVLSVHKALTVQMPKPKSSSSSQKDKKKSKQSGSKNDNPPSENRSSSDSFELVNKPHHLGAHFIVLPIHCCLLASLFYVPKIAAHSCHVSQFYAYF